MTNRDRIREHFCGVKMIRHDPTNDWCTECARELQRVQDLVGQLNRQGNRIEVIVDGKSQTVCAAYLHTGDQSANATPLCAYHADALDRAIQKAREAVE